MPATFQGTVVQAKGTPIPNLELPENLSRAAQRKVLDHLRRVNERHERELEALQKQAKTASDSYMALLGETETLKRQLEDYTLMFGERETGGKAKAG